MALRNRKAGADASTVADAADGAGPASSGSAGTDSGSRAVGGRATSQRGVSAGPAKGLRDGDADELSHDDAAQGASSWVDRHEALVPWIMLLLAAITRYYGLTHPRGIVFDETHFGKFTGWYMERKFYFDIHPPLGKLTFMAVGTLTGYDPSKCDYDAGISVNYGPGCQYYILRATAAFFSTVTCMLMYYCARELGAGVRGGIVAASLIILDGLNLTEGRLVLMDSQLIFWCVASLLIALRWWRRLNEHIAAEEAGVQSATAGEEGLRCFLESVCSPDAAAATRAPRLLGSLERNLWCVAVGFICANAPSVKMTGGATPAMVALESFVALWFLRRPAPFVDLLKIAAVSVLTYAGWFAAHFSLTQRTGPNEVEKEFMTDLFQSTLVGSHNYDPTGASRWRWWWEEGFWWTFVTLNKRMIVHNAAILEPHHWQSTWSEWIWDVRGVSYYGKEQSPGYSGSVYLIGNPAVLWSVVAFLGLMAVWCVFHLRARQDLAQSSSAHALFRQLTFCLAVYAINLMPYVGVARSTFIYHYMPALVYGELIAARLLEYIVPRAWVGGATKAYIGFVFAVWLHFAPWIYALPLTTEGHDRRRWMPRWN